MYIIYKHTNKLNGKSYIGKTTCVNNPNKRWKNGLGYSQKTQPFFYNAIQKYGWDNFEHEILENYILTAEEANLREQYWIAFYHTWVYDKNSNGYNISKGGKGSTGHKVSDETKSKLREKRLNQTNLSLSHNKGKQYYNNGIICKLCFPDEVPEGFVKGRLLSAEARDKISKAMSDNNKNRKGTLSKVCVCKDSKIKCIGAKNLDQYLAAGWIVYKNGTGGKI